MALREFVAKATDFVKAMLNLEKRYVHSSLNQILQRKFWQPPFHFFLHSWMYQNCFALSNPTENPPLPMAPSPAAGRGLISQDRATAGDRSRSNPNPPWLPQPSFTGMHGESVRTVKNLKNILLTMPRLMLFACRKHFLNPRMPFRFNGYSIERKDRIDSDKGGLAIMIKHGISYEILLCSDKIECQIIKINSKQQEITICNVYNPPNTVIEKEEYKTLFSIKNGFILGDFNSFSTLWGSPKGDKNGHILQELLDEFHAVVLNDGRGTYMKNLGGMSHLDLSFASPNLAIKCNWSVAGDLSG